MKMDLRTDYHITQALTDHGVLRYYLKKIKKQETDLCWYGCGETGTPEHCIFRCARFYEDRRKMQAETGQEFRVPADAQVLMSVKNTAGRLFDYLKDVMIEKDREEKKRNSSLSQQPEQ